MAQDSYPLGLDALQAISSHNQFAAQSFFFQRMMTGVATAKLVTVISCTNTGADAAIGTVNVQPLVNQMDGYNNAEPHGTIYSLPSFRYTGGVSAVILDPVAGDIGVIVCCDRDTSSALRTGQQANPGSRRTFDLADGLYIGAFLSKVPTQFVRFSAAGIQVKDVSGSTITMAGGGIALAPKNGIVVVTGAIMVSEGITAVGAISTAGGIQAGAGTADVVNLQLHIHSGVESGGADTSVPVPGI
jgi:hypothetical protein